MKQPGSKFLNFWFITVVLINETGWVAMFQIKLYGFTIVHEVSAVTVKPRILMHKPLSSHFTPTPLGNNINVKNSNFIIVLVSR